MHAHTVTLSFAVPSRAAWDRLIKIHVLDLPLATNNVLHWCQYLVMYGASDSSSSLREATITAVASFDSIDKVATRQVTTTS